MTIQVALQKFAATVSAKMFTLTRGEPEDQLRALFADDPLHAEATVAQVSGGDEALPSRQTFQRTRDM